MSDEDKQIWRTAYWIDQGLTVRDAMEMAEFDCYDELIFTKEVAHGNT